MKRQNFASQTNSVLEANTFRKKTLSEKVQKNAKVPGEKSEKKSELSQQYLSIFSVSCMH